MDRFQTTSFDVNVSSSMATSESTSYQATYQTAPLQSFASEGYGSDTSTMDYQTGFDSIQATLQSFQDSSLPSFQDTYNIHGTYAYMRQAEDTKPEVFTSFNSEDNSPGDKFTSSIQYHGQYQTFSDEAYLKQNFLENPEFYQKQGQAQGQSQGLSPGFSQEFSSSMPGFSPDQKDSVFHSGGFQSGQHIYQGGDRPQGFPGYPPGYYDSQRMSSTPDTNFNYPSPNAGTMFPIGRQPFQRRSSLTMDTG